MTIGIYLLEFKNTTNVYVGQSVNIENRYKRHLRSFINSTANYKLMEAYLKYGKPSLKIVLECNATELNDAETEAFSIFDSIENGYNVAKYSDIFQCGNKNPASKYSTETVERVFFKLLDPNNRIKTIANEIGVNESLVRHIASGESHTWLKDKYPTEYNILHTILVTKQRRVLSNSAKSRGIVYPIIEKDGVVKSIECVSTFAKEYDLDPSYLGKVLRGQYTSCKGWKLYNK